MYNSKDNRNYQEDERKFHCKEGQPIVFGNKIGKPKRKTCVNSLCWKHWKRWAKHQCKQLLQHLSEDHYHYRLRLNRPKEVTDEQWKYILLKLGQELKDRPGEVKWLWVIHNDTDTLHYHFLIQSDIEINTKRAKETFRKLLTDAYGIEVSLHDVFMKPANDYIGWLLYIFGIGEKEPKTDPPWTGIIGKSYSCSRGFYAK